MTDKGPAKWVPTVLANEAWKEEWGKFAKISHIIATLSVESGATFATWMWVHRIVGIVVCAITGCTAVGLYFFRKVRIRTAMVGTAYHCFTHDVRDQLSEMADEVRRVGSLKNKPYYQFGDMAASRIKRFFESFFGHDSIHCEIFLVSEEKDEKSYRVAGSSGGTSRRDWSRPIPYQSGLAAKFREDNRNGRGVIFISDVDQAMKEGWWTIDENDKHSGTRTALVSPINGYESNNLLVKVTIGFVVVRSTRKDFRLIHAEPLMGHADYLGTIYPLIGSGLTGVKP